jgi:lipopolysaccharide export LptBFGC system permease protein LptF
MNPDNVDSIEIKRYRLKYFLVLAAVLFCGFSPFLTLFAALGGGRASFWEGVVFGYSFIPGIVALVYFLISERKTINTNKLKIGLLLLCATPLFIILIFAATLSLN